MRYLERIKKSIYGPEYYQEVTIKPFLYSLKYFALLMLVFGLLKIITMIISFPGLNEDLGEIKSGLENKYPAELEVMIEKGVVSTNVQEPYFIKNEQFKGGDEEEGGEFENWIVIDTESVSVIDDIEKYNAMVLITKNQIVSRSEMGGVNVESLSSIPDLKINKEGVDNFLDKAYPYTKFIFPMMLLGIIFLVPFYALYNFAYMAIASLFVWVVAAIKGVDLDYAKAYKATMSLVTLPIILAAIIPSVYVPFFAFSVVVIILAFINFKKNADAGVEERKEVVSEGMQGEEKSE